MRNIPHVHAYPQPTVAAGQHKVKWMRLGQEQDIPSGGPRPRKYAVEKCPLWKPALRRWHLSGFVLSSTAMRIARRENAPSRHYPQEKSTGP
jgi:hypothetical protein